MKKVYNKPTTAMITLHVQSIIAVSPDLSTKNATEYSGGTVDSRSGGWFDDDED